MNVYKYNDYSDYVKCQQDANIKKKIHLGSGKRYRIIS